MLTPLSWLKDFADFPDDADLLRATLDDLGLVVEGVDVVGDGLRDVVVARIDEIHPIEGADRVRRVVIEAGDGPLDIVCGATNFAVGDFVPLAPVGSTLPGGFDIARRKMLGVTSNGMLCSGRELGLGDDHEGLMILSDPKAEPGVGIVDVLGIERDVIFDLAIEGNRPDAWCVRGVARDLAARLGLQFRDEAPSTVASSPIPTQQLLSAEVRDTTLCPRLGLSVLSGVRVTSSPRFIIDRLEKAGMRAINNVVDASNYVMLELGQPTHPYDLERIEGSGLIVRAASRGETLVTLDEHERELGVAGKSLGDQGIDIVICDATDTVIGLAGLMGGVSSEISEATTSVLLEAASFDPITVMRTSRRLALRSEASARFSKGTDPAILEIAMARFAELLALSCPDLSMAEPWVQPNDTPARTVIEVPAERIASLLGLNLDQVEIASLLEPRGFSLSESDGVYSVTVPTNRGDVRGGARGIADVIEEIARSYSYSKIPRHQLAWPEPGAVSARQRMRATLRDVVLGLGGSEAWTSSLVDSGELALLGIDEPEIVVTNPLTEGESRLRRSLLPGLLRSVGMNLERQQDDVILFEIGAVFVHPAVSSGRWARAGSQGGSEVAMPDEVDTITVVFAHDGADATTAVAALRMLSDSLGLEGVEIDQKTRRTAELAGLHPTRSGLVRDRRTGVALGVVGEIDPQTASRITPALSGRRVGILSLDIGRLGDTAKATRRSELAQVVSRFPSSIFDMAFVLADDVVAGDLAKALTAAAGELIESLSLFDVYRGPGVEAGSRSLAFRLKLSAEDRTLDDTDITAVRDACIAAAARELGATLR